MLHKSTPIPRTMTLAQRFSDRLHLPRLQPLLRLLELGAKLRLPLRTVYLRRDFHSFRDKLAIIVAVGRPFAVTSLVKPSKIEPDVVLVLSRLRIIFPNLLCVVLEKSLRARIFSERGNALDVARADVFDARFVIDRLTRRAPRLVGLYAAPLCAFTHSSLVQFAVSCALCTVAAKGF